MRLLKLLPLVAALTVATVAPVQARFGGADWRGSLYPLNIGAGPGEALVDFDHVIAGSHASYRNGSAGVSFAVAGRQLEPGHAYTVWLMAFNHPELCRGGPNPTAPGMRCSQDDHLNPATGFSIMYGTGAWAKGKSVNFQGTRAANSVFDIPTDVMLGPGLVNPSGAEIHLRIRDHGPAQAGMEDDQISTFAGGCDDESAPVYFGPREESTRGDYPCVDIHTTAS